MGISGADPRFLSENLYFLDDFEGVKFRWDYKTKKVFRKWLGETLETEVHYTDRLFHDAVTSGTEITAAAYDRGRQP